MNNIAAFNNLIQKIAAKSTHRKEAQESRDRLNVELDRLEGELDDAFYALNTLLEGEALEDIPSVITIFDAHIADVTTFQLNWDPAEKAATLTPLRLHSIKL